MHLRISCTHTAQDTAYYFDTTNPYQPKFKKSNRGILSSITDEIRAKPDGGFFITCKSVYVHCTRTMH